MGRRVSSKLSYANVMATLAVFIGLGGIGYAAVNLPANSVGTKQLKKGAVTSAKLQNGAVTAAKIKARSLTGAQIKLSQLGTVPAAKIANTATSASSPVTLARGKTLTGDYRTSYLTRDAIVTDTQSFAFPLASAPTVHFVGIGASPPAQCPGTATNPHATPGNLCVYAAAGDVSPTAVSISNPEADLAPFASPRGFTASETNIPSFSSGSWAVTAP
jgi:hypothetical protein